MVKDENGNMLAYSRNILNRQDNHFCQLLNVHGVNDDGQTELHKTEPLVPKFRRFELEILNEKLKSINHQALIQFRQNRSKQKVIHYVLKSTRLLILT
jgi:hypothetical protein